MNRQVLLYKLGSRFLSMSSGQRIYVILLTYLTMVCQSKGKKKKEVSDNEGWHIDSNWWKHLINSLQHILNSPTAIFSLIRSDRKIGGRRVLLKQVLDKQSRQGLKKPNGYTAKWHNQKRQWLLKREGFLTSWYTRGVKAKPSQSCTSNTPTDLVIERWTL